MKQKKRANIFASLYGRDFTVDFECVGPEGCPDAMCELMPPGPESMCYFMVNGSCRNTQAQHSAIMALQRRLKENLKQLEEA